MGDDNDKPFDDIGGTILPKQGSEPPPGNVIVHANPARLTLKAYPATITITSSGTLQAATASAQSVFALTVPEKGDRTEPVLAFLKAARQKDEVLVRTARFSDTMTFASIGLDIDPLTESEAQTALDQYFIVDGRRQGLIRGLLIASVPSLLLGVAAIIKLLT